MEERRARFGWIAGVLGAAGVAGIVGCDGDPEKEPISIDDTAADSDADSDTDTDADTDSDTDADTDAFDGVIIRYIDRYVGPDGSEIPQDRDPFDGVGLIQIRTYAADGTSTLYPASLAAPGELQFPGVPVDPYILEVYSQPDLALNLPGRQDFIEMDARAPDYGRPLAGRPNVAVAAGSLPLTLDLSNLNPIQISGEELLSDGSSIWHDAQTRLEIHSYNADALAQIAPRPDDAAQQNAPARGDTALSGFTVDWAASAFSYVRAGAPLVAAGDDLTVVQLAETVSASERADGWSWFVWRTPVAALSAEVAMADGQAATIAGEMAPLTPTDYAVDLRGSAYTALIEPAGPISYGVLSLSVVREPGTPDPIIGVTPTVLAMEAYSYQDEGGAWIHPGDLAQTFPIGDPYTAGQQNLVVFSAQYAPFTDAQGGDEGAYTYISDTLPAPAQAGQPITPLLGPVGAIRIGGMEAPAGTILAGVGAQPTITFDAPAVGTPDFYIVTLRCLDDIYDEGGALIYRRRTVASWATTAREVTFPQGILTIGSSYDLQVQAILGYRLDGYAFQNPYAVSQQATGTFTP